MDLMWKFYLEIHIKAKEKRNFDLEVPRENDPS